jgi:iron complex transport system permease protein
MSGAGGMTVLAAGPWSIRVLRRSVVVAAAMVLALLLAALASLTLGAHLVSPAGAVSAILGEGMPADRFIVGQLRLPRIVAAALVGTALGIAGAIFQSVSRNPLGSPDVIGLDVGASTGALVSLLLVHASTVGAGIGAVVGGTVTAGAVVLLAVRRGLAPLRLVLVGIGAAAMLAAVNSTLIVRANLYDAQSASIWLVGNLAGRGWAEVAILGPVVAVGVVLAVLLARPLALGEFADDRAAALGSHPGRVRIAAIGVAVLLASGAVAIAGPIPFIALTAPQIVRRLTRAPGPNLVLSGLGGAVLLVLADLAAREAFQPRQLPVGVVSGVVGGVYLAWLLGREWRRGRA